MLNGKTRVIFLVPPEKKFSSNKYNKRGLRNESVFPPLGIAYIAAYLKKNGFEVAIIDSLALRISQEEIVSKVNEFKPDFIGITVLTQQFGAAVDLAQALKASDPKTPIIFGGIHIFSQHEEIIKSETCVDFCVRGEGELTLLELIRTIQSGGRLSEVKGVTYRENGGTIVSPDREFIKNLDDLPFPAWELLPMDLYRGPISLDNRRHFVSVLATRGCPFKCHYCELASMWRTQRRRSVENVLAELEVLKNKYHIKFIDFVDDLLVADKKWAIRLFQGMVKMKLNTIRWECSGRIGLMGEELLKEMKKAGCVCVNYGIEFGSQRMLDFVNKNITIQQIYDTVALTNKVGIPVKGLFMLGYPTETKADIEETINLSRNLKMDFLATAIVAPYPGTQLYQYCQEHDLFRVDDWKRYDISQIRFKAIKLKDMTLDELLEYNGRIDREFILRPRYMLKMLFKHPIAALKFGPAFFSKLFQFIPGKENKK